MVSQSRLVSETLVARVTLERTVRHVCAHVRLEVGQLTEGFLTARMSAAVRFLARVGAQVLLEVTELGEGPSTHHALVGLEAGVDALVL